MTNREQEKRLEQKEILDMLCKPQKSKYMSEDEFDNIGIYGSGYCSIDHEDDEYYEEDEEEEDDW